MLAFVFTDAAGRRARSCRSCWPTPPTSRFNCVTVDGDTSTSDTLLLFATGAAGQAADRGAPTTAPGRLQARAGRGAARPRASAGRATARAPPSSSPSRSTAPRPTARRARSGSSVANSPLVKTAIAGEDANWGRIVMAVGKSGERADRDKLSDSIGGVKIADGGRVVPNYDETPVAELHQGHRHRDRHRSRHRPRPRHGLDLRSDPRLHRHQRQLSFLSPSLDEECPGGPPPLGDGRWSWSPPWRWSTSTAGC